MADRVYPAAKPNPPPAAAAAPPSANGAPAKTTQQLYNPNRPRPMYRPPQNRHSQRRSCCSCRKFCCLCFLYTLITLLSLLLIAAIAACVFYLLYHPKHPTFSVTSVKISRFNLTVSDPSSGFSRLNSRVDFTLSAKNPNSKKIIFSYDPILINLKSGSVDAGNATLSGFVHTPGNTTILRATVNSDPTRDWDSDAVGPLRSGLTKKSGFPLSVEVNTKVEVQMGKVKSKKVGIRVTCEGIHGFQPKNSSAKAPPTLGTTSDAKCKVDLRIKIWKFTF